MKARRECKNKVFFIMAVMGVLTATTVALSVADTPAGAGPDAGGGGTLVVLPDESQGPELEVPDNADVILSTGPGSGDELLAFRPEQDVFTVLAVCDAGPAVDFSTQDSSEPVTLPCDGIPTTITFVSDGGQQKLQIDGTGTTDWSATLIEGDGPNLVLGE